MKMSGLPLVAHVIYRLDVGGLENGVVNLVNRMPLDRYRHVIVCLAGFGPNFRARIQRNDVEVVSIDKRPGKDPAMYWRVWRTLKQLGPDIVHTRNLGTLDLQWVAWAAGVRHRVHGEHGWEASDPEGRHPRTLRIRRACRPVIQRYVPMSLDLARWLREDIGVPAERIRQLYSGVDTQRFYPSSSDPYTGDRTTTIGTVGRLDPVKHHEALLEALSAICKAQPAQRLRLIIVGDGPLRERLHTRSVELGIAGQVEFTGARSDTPDQLRRMDVFVLPSLNEGISNTILEAMATGLPVVAGRVGGNPELVLDGTTGRLYDPQQPRALEQALGEYLADPGLRRAQGYAGRQRVLDHFGLDAMVQRYLDLYDELLNPGPSAHGSSVHGGRAWPRAESK
jgi:sugar transferase (PEP-CTERM/EpsH1 system associated)